jgi:hypothetical protein
MRVTMMPWTIATGIAEGCFAVVNSSNSNIDVLYHGTSGDLEDACWSDTAAGYQIRSLPTG